LVTNEACQFVPHRAHPAGGKLADEVQREGRLDPGQAFHPADMGEPVQQAAGVHDSGSLAEAHPDSAARCLYLTLDTRIIHNAVALSLLRVVGLPSGRRGCGQAPR
jgi:hypothetical protein